MNENILGNVVSAAGERCHLTFLPLKVVGFLPNYYAYLQQKNQSDIFSQQQTPAFAPILPPTAGASRARAL